MPFIMAAISIIRFLKFIIWCEADILLLPGESMRLFSSKVFVNDKYHHIKFIIFQPTAIHSGKP